jgi:hypothetical protein
VARLAAVVLSALWSLAPAASVLHELERAHRYCAEHGDLEDTEAGQTGGAPSESSEHERCPFGKVHLTHQTIAIGPTAAVPLVSCPVATAALAAVLPAIAVLENAPKTSPPVGA